MIKKINQTVNLDEELNTRLMEELENKNEFDCWINWCSQNYTW